MSSPMKKRILVLSRTFPYAPARGGDMSYSRGLISDIARSADVLAVVASNGEQPEGSVQRDGVSWQVAGMPKSGRLGSVLSSLPNIAWRGRTTAYVKAVEAALASEWDAIVLDQIGSAHLLSQVLAYRSRHRATQVVYISHEHEASVRAEKYAAYGGNPLLRLALRMDGFKVAACEMALLRTVDVVSVINPDDRARYAAQVPGLRFATLTPGYTGKVVEQRRIDAGTPRRVVVLGGRESRQKQLILEKWLEASADIFGKHDVEMVVAGPIDESLEDTLTARFPSVKFLGFVDDIEALLASCRASVVADFLGGGFKVRLLTYVFNRVPMFALKGAISGLGVSGPGAFSEFNDLRSLAKGICAKINDLDYLNALQDTAFKGCTGRFDWSERGEMLITALDTPRASCPIQTSDIGKARENSLDVSSR